MTLNDIQKHISDFLLAPAQLRQAGLQVQVYEDSCFSVSRANSTNSQYDVFISGLVHGNEVGGLAAINLFLKKILNKPSQLQSSLLFHIGNREAALQNKRFLERDLNRSFLIPTSASKLEEKIAKKMESYVLKCKYSLDLHQTNSSSKTPFFIFSYSEQSHQWVRFLEAKIPAITSVIERHKEGSTLDFFCCKNKIPSCTLELGQAGFDPVQIEYGCQILQKLLQPIHLKPLTQFESMYKVIETVYWNQERVYLKEGFENFSQVKKGDLIGTIRSKDVTDERPYFSPHTGAVLFPKYGKIADITQELVTFAQPISSVLDLNEEA